MALGAPVATQAAVREALTGKKRDLGTLVFEGVLLLTLLVSLGVLLVLLAGIFGQGWSVYAERGTGFLTSQLSSLPERAGIWQGIVGSLLIVGFVVVLAFPLGVGAAIFLEEYASDTGFTRFINANIRNLAGVPSIVFGILGLVIFVQALEMGRSVLAGGITMAILVAPIVIITAAEALRAVPQGIREAGYGVGATKWEVIRSHVLPYAAPGILTGTVLSLSRAIGETAPLLLVGAITGTFFTGSQTLTERIMGPYTTLPTIIYSWARLPDPEFQKLTSAAIMALLVVVLVVNSVAILLRNRYERKW